LNCKFGARHLFSYTSAFLHFSQLEEMPKTYYTLGTDIEFVGPPPAIEKDGVQVALVKIKNVEQYLAFTIKPDDHKCLRPLDHDEITNDLETLGLINEKQNAKVLAKRLTDNGNRFSGILSPAFRTYAASTEWLMAQLGKTNQAKFQERLVEKDAEVHKNGIIPLVAPKDQKILRANLEGSAFVPNEPKEVKVVEKPKRKAAEKKPKGAGKAPRDASPVRPAPPKEKNVFERAFEIGKKCYERIKDVPEEWKKSQALWPKVAFKLSVDNPSDTVLAHLYCVILAVGSKLPALDQVPDVPELTIPDLPERPGVRTAENVKAYAAQLMSLAKRLHETADEQSDMQNDFKKALADEYTLEDWTELIHNSPMTIQEFVEAVDKVKPNASIAHMMAVCYAHFTNQVANEEKKSVTFDDIF
jgi:hypothetical protein